MPRTPSARTSSAWRRHHASPGPVKSIGDPRPIHHCARYGTSASGRPCSSSSPARRIVPRISRAWSRASAAGGRRNARARAPSAYVSAGRRCIRIDAGSDGDWPPAESTLTHGVTQTTVRTPSSSRRRTIPAKSGNWWGLGRQVL
ncbi:unannotated protein [freshwater metagenome]|uniref:Unannotated protein n=1 Tax=freshwater metagenome TaxID=449393 RepID=A0A6J7IYR1_9ZZZZ